MNKLWLTFSIANFLMTIDLKNWNYKKMNVSLWQTGIGYGWTENGDKLFSWLDRNTIFARIESEESTTINKHWRVNLIDLIWTPFGGGNRSEERNKQSTMKTSSFSLRVMRRVSYIIFILLVLFPVCPSYDNFNITWKWIVFPSLHRSPTRTIFTKGKIKFIYLHLRDFN